MGQAGIDHLAADEWFGAGGFGEPKQAGYHHRAIEAEGRQGQQLRCGIWALVGHHRGGAAQIDGQGALVLHGLPLNRGPLLIRQVPLLT